MDPKKTKESRRKYDADFKNEVLKMVESGRSVPEIAQSIGIYYWVKQAKKSQSTQKDKPALVSTKKSWHFRNELRNWRWSGKF